VLTKLAPTLTPLRQSMRSMHITAVNLKARKGTREKARKKKVKVEILKVGFIPHNLRKKHLAGEIADKHIDDSWKQIPTDNVYPGRYYRTRLFSITDAIEAHRETNHPTMFDAPDASINICIEMNMQGEKQTRFVTNFQKNAMIEYPFDHGEERTIVAFVKDEELAKKAREAGASLVGGVDTIKDIQVGKVTLNDFQFVVAHPDILPELVAIRGLLKRKFPNPKMETLGLDVEEMVKRFLTGINYKAQRDSMQENFGTVDTSVGTLRMPTEHLRSNILAVLNDVNTFRPKRPGAFITRVIVTSPPSKEFLKLDPKEFPFEDVEGNKFAKKKKGKGKSKAIDVTPDDKPADVDSDDDEGVTKKATTKN